MQEILKQVAKGIIPVQTGIQYSHPHKGGDPIQMKIWIPAFAGMMLIIL